MASGKTKPKLWRRMSKKYYDEKTGTWIRPGRQLKMFTMGYDGKKQAFGLVASLLLRQDDVTETLKRYVKKVKEVKTDETK